MARADRRRGRGRSWNSVECRKGWRERESERAEDGTGWRYGGACEKKRDLAIKQRVLELRAKGRGREGRWEEGKEGRKKGRSDERVEVSDWRS
jgi:hypothetical protein